VAKNNTGTANTNQYKDSPQGGLLWEIGLEADWQPLSWLKCSLSASWLSITGSRGETWSRYADVSGNTTSYRDDGYMAGASLQAVNCCLSISIMLNQQQHLPIIKK
jgi:hypothetical protein